MNACAISFRVSATGQDLTTTVLLDDRVIYQATGLLDGEQVRHEFDDRSDSEHVLVFKLSGKLPQHTQLDPQGNILSDALVTISDLAFDDIKLGHTFTAVGRYHHDHNGTGASVTEPFYGVMGCNGRAEMRFTTPIYLWLLENM